MSTSPQGRKPLAKKALAKRRIVSCGICREPQVMSEEDFAGLANKLGKSLEEILSTSWLYVCEICAVLPQYQEILRAKTPHILLRARVPKAKLRVDREDGY